MDERVARLKTPEECEQFALNVQARLPELARAARRGPLNSEQPPTVQRRPPSKRL